ncbi:N-terminal EF-hand calcium-binding protein 1 [Tachysurus ichikawai]
MGWGYGDTWGNSRRVDVKVPEHLSLQKNNRRCGRRVQKNMCLSPTDPYSGILTTGVTVDTDDHWSSQINRLQQLIDKLECQSPKLEPLKEDPLASTYKSNILLVQRQMAVTEDNLEEFQKALKSYADSTTNQSDNLHVSIQKLPEKSCYIIYEFWQDRIAWMSYLQSEASKTFQRSIIDMLEDPELVSTMLLPASWWIMTNN